MTQLSSISLALADAYASDVNFMFHEFFDTQKLDDYARKVNLKKRARKMDYGKLTASAINLLTSGRGERNLKLADVHRYYVDILGAEEISAKCFDKALDKEQLKDFAVALNNALLVTINQMKFNGDTTRLLNELCQELQLKDIILIDGTEVPLQYNCSGKMECKAAGRDHKDGSPARPGVKLHVIFSLKKQTVEHIEITEAVGNEKDNVHMEEFNNCLLVMDRGYVSDELERKIKASGNFYLIKGKTNMTDRIVNACDGNGNALEDDIKGKKISGVKDACRGKDCYLDCDVEDASRKSGHKLRIIRADNIDRDCQNELVYLRTNMPRDLVSAYQIHQLYRLRWNVEIFMKCLKSGNGLHSINVSNPCIILYFLLMSVFCSLIKTAFSLIAEKRFTSLNLSMLKLHTFSLFKEYLPKLFKVKRSRWYQIVSKLLNAIKTHCQRTEPSARDAEKLKDIHSLVAAILTNGTSTKAKTA